MLHHSKKYVRRKVTKTSTNRFQAFSIAHKVNVVLQAAVFSLPFGTNLGPIPWNNFRD